MSAQLEQLTQAVFNRALAGDLLALQSLPKADLHTHVLLAAPHEVTAAHLAVSLPQPPSRFPSLQSFLEHLDAHYWPHYGVPEKMLTILDSALSHMVADGVVETELSFDVLMPHVARSSWAEFAPRLRDVIAAHAHRIEVRPELGFARELPRSLWLPEVQAALETKIFRSIDLYGDEQRFPAQAFGEYFARARGEGLKVKIHAGEGGDAERLLHEIQFVEPSAIQHGVAAAKSAICMNEIIARRIQLNVCPTSNVALSVVASYQDHPIDTLVRAGVKVTIASDDLAIFGSSVSNEYLELYRAGKLTVAELEQVRCNGLSRGHRLSPTGASQ